MAERRVDVEELPETVNYDLLDVSRRTLAAMGIEACEEINAQNLPIEQQWAATLYAAKGLNEQVPYGNELVFVSGPRWLQSPLVPLDVTDSDDLVNGGVMRVLGMDAAFGRSHGFSVRLLDTDHGTVEPVMCHAVRVGEPEEGTDNEGNLIMLQRVAHFALIGSEVDFMPDLHLAFDDILSSSKRDFGGKFRALYAALELLYFSGESPRNQAKIIDFLNASDLFEVIIRHDFKAKYGMPVTEEGVGEVEALSGMRITGEFHGFAAVDYRGTEVTEEGSTVAVTSPGVGVLTTVYRDDEPHEYILPLNQQIRRWKEKRGRGGEELLEAA